MAVKQGRVGKKRTKSAAKKRIAQTGTGQYKIQKVAHKHLLLQKSKRQKAKASKPIILQKGDAARAAQML